MEVNLSPNLKKLTLINADCVINSVLKNVPLLLEELHLTGVIHELCSLNLKRLTKLSLVSTGLNFQLKQVLQNLIQTL